MPPPAPSAVLRAIVLLSTPRTTDAPIDAMPPPPLSLS
jgi:hypothetical protein